MNGTVVVRNHAERRRMTDPTEDMPMRYCHDLHRNLGASFIAAILMIAATGTSWSADLSQPLRANGIEIFYGVIPAEIILGHPADHEERKMHGGAPRSSGQHHLVISIFDEKTRERVANASVTARVGEIGMSVQEKKLEPMQFADTATYGNYFRMTAPGPYRIEIEIRRSATGRPIRTTFEYSHPRR